jgi:acyl dehydratase
MEADCSVAPVSDFVAVPPVYRVRAHNAALDSENRIHDDAEARRHGFRGGLVPGVTVYAYMTHPVVEAFGRAWLERGTMSVRFHQPFYEGDTVTVTAAPCGPGAFDLTATNDAGAVCASGQASLTAPGGVERPDPTRLPEAPLPAERCAPAPEALAAMDILGSIESGFHAGRAHGFLGQLDDDHEVYGRDGLAHPGWLLRKANDVLAANVRLGPWIHVASAVANLGVVADGDRVTARARVANLSTRKGHELVELEVLLVVGSDRPVTHVRHTAIYRLRAPESGTTRASS